MVAGAALIGLILAGIPLMTLMGGEAAVDRDDDPGGDPGGDPSGDRDGDAPASDSTEDAHPVAPAQEDPQQDDPLRGEPIPVDYEFIFRAGDQTVAGFRPGTDTLTLTSDTWDLRLAHIDGGDGGAVLEIERAGEVAALRFPGLAEVPVSDIYVNIAENGDAPVVLPLSEVVEPAPVLQPTAPDAPEDPPPEPIKGMPVAPADPDATDALPDPIDAGPPLLPTDPDAPEA